MDARFEELGITSSGRSGVLSLLDRREKLKGEAWLKEASDLGLSRAQVSGLEGLVDDPELWKRSSELSRFFAAIEALGLTEFVRYDASIVRGLQYYTGTVFEAWEVGGEIRRSLLGGGRYDRLLSDVGGTPLPAVGFALGDVVMSLLLEKYDLLPGDLKIHPAPILVTVFGTEYQHASLMLATELRQASLNVALYPDPEKLGRQFKYADKIRARLALVLGPDEAAADCVTVKDLRTGVQESVERARIAAACRGALEAPRPG